MKFLTVFFFSFLVACGGPSTSEVESTTPAETTQTVDVSTVPASNDVVGDVVVTAVPTEQAQQVTTCADGSAPVNGVCQQVTTQQVETTVNH
jgi:hypothetical protein